MGSPVWLKNGGSPGGEFGLAQLDPEEAGHPRPSCAGVGAEACPAAKAVRGRLWARSSGERQGMVLPVVLQLDLSEDIPSQLYPWSLPNTWNRSGRLTYQGLGMDLSWGCRV